jgi:hypothetical protein
MEMNHSDRYSHEIKNLGQKIANFEVEKFKISIENKETTFEKGTISVEKIVGF